MDFIFIEDLRVQTRVGIYPREKTAMQTIELSLAFGMPDNAMQRDNIADTINYAEVVARIRSELQTHYFNLIEKLGEFVASLLIDEFGAPWVRLRIAKVGVMKGVRRVGVVIQRGECAAGLNDSGNDSCVI